MKILLTGAAGFTGAFFNDTACKAGHEVAPLLSNLTDKAAVVAEVLSLQPDAVVHLAAISYVGHKDDAAFYAVNVVGTTNLLDALVNLKKPLNKVLLASSANIYGNCEASPIREEQPPAPVNHYSMSKLAMEYMAQTYMHCLPIILTRPFNYIGPGQSPNFLIPKLVSHFVSSATSIELGNLDVEREFNDVRTVCEAYMALLTHGQAGSVYNVCSGKPHTLKFVLNTLSKLTGHNIKVTVNQNLLRSNEVHRLCGDPSKLNELIERSKAPMSSFNLEETLRWMLLEEARP